MPYMDIFVGPVLIADKDAYAAYARMMGELTLQAGALSVTACWGSDCPDGMANSFASAVKLQPGETIVTRFVRWTSKDMRDAAWAEMMKTRDMQSGSMPMPFDRTRVIFGGFEVLGEE